MPIEIADRTDLHRFIDDVGRPQHSGDSQTFDPPEPWSPLDDELGDSPFALSFDFGGEG